MKLGTIYFKTDKGRAEIASRSGLIDASQRRLLIMVDGKKTVNDLGAFVRVGELPGALDQLLLHGLVDSEGVDLLLDIPAAPGFAAPASPGEAPRAATNPEEFARVRDEASRFVSERLGNTGAPIAGAIDRCKSPDELRRLLRSVETFVGDRLDAETAKTFARHFGSLLL
jgi:hypothetical protein